MLNLPFRRYAFIALTFIGALLTLVAVTFDDEGAHLSPPSAGAKTDRDGTYDLAKARFVARVVGQVRAHYVEPDRVDERAMAAAALQAVQSHVPEVMVDIKRDRKAVPTAIDVTVAGTTKHFSLERISDLYELNWKLMDIFDFLERQLPPSTDLQELEFAAINGLLSTLDPHSLLLSPRVYREMRLGHRGRFGGLGIVVNTADGVLTITSIMDGTPADEADLAVDDQIVQIDQESTVNMSLDEAVNLLRGAAGAPVTLWIRREGWAKPRPIIVTRREISVPSVEHTDLGDGIGYIYIRNFQENTSDNLYDALLSLSKAERPLNGVVVDLRDNPGGLLDRAISVSDAFLSRGTIVTTVREGSRERDESHATQANTLDELPLVVLINGGSASASEIVAGALKRNDRALVVGERSFGKGSVQVIYKIDEAALKLTVAQYLTPGDVSIQSVGIVPDIAISSRRASKDALDLLPDALRRKGEAGLASHLDSSRTVDEKPSVQLRMVETTETRSPRRRRLGKITPDALMLLAKDLLRAAPATDRRQQLIQAAGFIAKREAQEDEALRAALATRGTDWQPGPVAKRPALTVALAVRGANAGAALTAGTQVVVRAAITNTGDDPVYRVHGQLASAIGTLNGVELAFGRIGPGETVKRERTVTLPKRAAAAGDRVTLELFADELRLDQEGATEVTIEPLPRPAFAHTWRILDPKGNGDGLIQRGEQLELEVQITNVGAGPAFDVLSSLKNESGPEVFIKEGRAALGSIAPGQTRTARFALTVREALKARSVQLKLSISAQQLNEWSNSHLSARVFPAGFPGRKARGGAAAIGPSPVPVRAGAHRDSLEVAEAAPHGVIDLVGAAGEWLEVAWNDGDGTSRRGWISASRAAVVATGHPTPDAVRPFHQHQPPVLEMKVTPLVTNNATMTLAGVARFHGSGKSRRHVYVFRGDDKVFFRSAESAEGMRDELSFEAPVALERGANRLMIVAREGDDDVTRRRITIYRR